MSDLHRFGIVGDFRARIARVLPGVTVADLAALDLLIARDRLISDAGAAHPDLMAWVQRILDRDLPGAAAVPVVPAPKPDLHGAEVAA